MYEQEGTLIEDLIDCYNAYNRTLTMSKENRIQAGINMNLDYIAHLVANTNASHPKKYNREFDDFLFKPKKPSLREQAEEMLLKHD